MSDMLKEAMRKLGLDGVIDVNSPLFEVVSKEAQKLSSDVAQYMASKKPEEEKAANLERFLAGHPTTRSLNSMVANNSSVELKMLASTAIAKRNKTA